MGLFSFFSPREVDEFAKQLAQDISKRYPPSMDNSDKKVSANRLSKILEDAFTKAQTFNQEKKLGMYKKARLGNTFQWGLRDMGYSQKFIDIATEGLIVYMTRKQSSKS
jgi:hypothetical protein